MNICEMIFEVLGEIFKSSIEKKAYVNKEAKHFSTSEIGKAENTDEYVIGIRLKICLVCGEKFKETFKKCPWCENN